MAKSWGLPLLTLLMAAWYAGPVAAQTIRGQVVDEETGRPVLIASVILVDAERKSAGVTLIDSTGWLVLTAPAAGRYSLRADARGYATLMTDPIALGPDETLEVELRVSDEVVQLDPVTVEGEAERFRPAMLRGFYERKERGWGQFITREDIEQRNPDTFTTMLRMVPGWRVKPHPRGGRHYTVRPIGRPDGCSPVLYLDGIKLGPISTVTEFGVDIFLFPSEVEAVELYRPSEVSAEFAGSDAGCGVIAAWTRRSP